MGKLRVFLLTLILAAWAPFSWAVDLGTANGVRFFQISYLTASFTPVGWMQVDLNLLRNSTGVTKGFLNVATPAGWVVRNLPVPAEDVYPYSMINTQFNLGVTTGTAVAQQTALVSYTAALQTAFAGTPSTAFSVSEYTMSIGATGGISGGGPVTPPTFTDILFSDQGKNDFVFQWDHPNEQAADSQCGPMSVANSLQFLHDTQGLALPFEHKMGLKGDDSLVGKIDTAADRTAPGRGSGSGVSTMDAKLKFLATNGMADKVETMIWGTYGADSGASNTTTTVGGISATATGKGTTIKFDEIIQQLKEGADCEMIYSFAGGGAHAVDIVGAGFHNGDPWVVWTSDIKQADLPNGDSEGAGPEGMEFGYLGKPVNNQYKSGNKTFQKVICEKPVKPPVTETVTHVTDPAGHSCCVTPPPSTVRVNVFGSAMTVTGAASWMMPLRGTITPTGSFSLASTATVAGFSNVSTTFIGTTQGNNYIGTITVGANGKLPSSQPIIYDVSIARESVPARPAIRANGFRHNYMAMNSSELLRLSLDMTAGSQAGQPVDSWIVAVAGPARFHFDIDTFSWKPGIAPSSTGPMADMPFFALPYLALPTGTYDVYFGFDTVPDGVLNGEISYDMVRMTVP